MVLLLQVVVAKLLLKKLLKKLQKKKLITMLNLKVSKLPQKLSLLKK